jgi:DNA repair exonuclease SbcCD ATPase subunit
MRIEFHTTRTLKNGNVRDNFNIQVINTKGSGSYSRNSGGEKKRANICIFKAARELLRLRSSLSLNCSFYDEFTDSLDPVGQDLVFQLMEQEAQDIGTVFLITHSPVWKSRFLEKGRKIITVTKGSDHISKVTFSD